MIDGAGGRPTLVHCFCPPSAGVYRRSPTTIRVRFRRELRACRSLSQVYAAAPGPAAIRNSE